MKRCGKLFCGYVGLVVWILYAFFASTDKWSSVGQKDCLGKTNIFCHTLLFIQYIQGVREEGSGGTSHPGRDDPISTRTQLAVVKLLTFNISNETLNTQY